MYTNSHAFDFSWT